MKNSRGSALVITLAMLFLFSAMGLGALNYSGMQTQYAAQQVLSIQAFWMAEAGATYAQTSLQNQISVNLQGAINKAVAANVSSSCNTYYSSSPQTPLKLLADYGGFTLSNPLNAASSLFPFAVTPSTPFTLGNNQGTFNATISITPGTSSLGTNPTFINQVYTFYYNYTISSTGGVGSSVSRGVQLGTGSFTVTVQLQNFAQYGLFTANQSTNVGGIATPVYFTSSTVYNGPIATNTHFNFAGNPNLAGLAGTFNGLVTQADVDANFYNNANPILLNSNNNGTIDVPKFNAGFLRGQTVITLPTNGSTQASLLSSALGPTTQPGTNGVYVPNSSGSLVGGIFVEGDANSIALSGDSNNAVYTITQGSAVTTITVNYPTLTTTCIGCANTTGTTTYSGIPNGQSTGSDGTLIYVTGMLSNASATTGLSGIVQGNTLLTISVVGNIEIAGNVSYEPVWTSSTTYAANSEVTYNTGIYNSLQNGNTNEEPDTQTAYWATVTPQNILGLISWTGNISVATTAPNNVVIDGVLIAPEGEGLTVDSYTNTSVGPRGTIQLLGGVIGASYGGVGQSNGLGLIAGYSRDFTYDSRMSNGTAPLFFPYTGQYTTNDNVGSSTSWNTVIPWAEVQVQ